MLSELALRDYWREYKAEKAVEIKPEEVERLQGLKFRVKDYIVNLEKAGESQPKVKG